MQTNFQLKKHNTLKIFKAMRTKICLSRKELSALTGLSWGSVSSICNDLLQKGVLLAEKEASAGGRPAEKLLIHPDKFLQLGIDVNSTGLSFVVIDLSGTVKKQAFLPIAGTEKSVLLQSLYPKTQTLLDEFPEVIGINLSMQGKINRRTGVSLRTNFFQDWKDVPLVRLFEEKFRLPTVLYHDPDCLLYYHLHNDPRLEGKQNGFVIRIDDGIGMARLIGGRLYTAGEEASYELGHTIVVPNGRACACGKRGCLESYASLRGMREIYKERSGACSLSFTQKLQSGDAQAQALLSDATAYLGVSIANLFTLSSPEFILLDGALFAKFRQCFSNVKRHAVSALNDDCNLLLAHYKKEAPAVGACLLTIENNAEEILFGI